MDRIGVDLIVDGLENNPQCPHGPTVLFKRLGKKSREYYSCSAYRNHKDCSFYLLKGQKQAPLLTQRIVVNRKSKLKTLKCVYERPTEDRGYCQTCNELFVVSEGGHMACKTVTGLREEQLQHPSALFIPKDKAQKEAQYFFTTQTIRNVMRLIEGMKIRNVLCVGTPTLHEYIKTEPSCVMDSLLLDIDNSYHNFYGPKEFVWFNMFNFHFFHKSGLFVVTDYLKKKGRTLLLMDPPFGGRVELLGNTIDKLNSIHLAATGSPIGVMWFFPYFMEHHITNSLPNFKMLDYKVDYGNHKSFTDHGPRKRKFGSPVRIFTNLPLAEFNMTGIPGYRFCQECLIWVAAENTHCFPCGLCTSKNGQTYTHCSTCHLCVKPSYAHCHTCKRCCLKSHVCGEFQPDTSCYHCYEPGHKKHQCPQREHPGGKRKATKAYQGRGKLVR